jgi:hypothetical protein
MKQMTLLTIALGLIAMRLIARDERAQADLVTRLRLAGAL